MQNWSKTATDPLRVNVLLFEAFSNHCLANAIEPLRAANTLSRKTLYLWQFFTPDGETVASSSGLQVAPDGRVSDAVGDLLIVMPSYQFRQHSDWQTLRMLKSAARRHKLVAGLDTGSWLLADAGLLDGYRATIHWDELIAFEEWFPDVSVERERFVIDRNRITCSGAMATFDLVMRMISDSHGPFLAMEVGQLFMSLGEGSNAPVVRNPASRLVQRAISVMQAHLEDPILIADIACQVGASQKSLEQRMKAEMKTTPQAIYRRLRLGQARKLVQETELRIAEIAARCGYENAGAMSRAFKAEFGATPRALRDGRAQ